MTNVNCFKERKKRKKEKKEQINKCEICVQQPNVKLKADTSCSILP
jgi:hypothetical protein